MKDWLTAILILLAIAALWLVFTVGAAFRRFGEWVTDLTWRIMGK